MKLEKIIENIDCDLIGERDIEISGLYQNDKDVQENGLFFCIVGTRSNGCDYIKNAINNGAKAIVVQEKVRKIRGLTQIIVKNVRSAMSLMACNFYGNPSMKLKMIGVTGTNGKTTVTHMLAGLINQSGKRCAIIGTNGIIFKGKTIDTGMTTPDPIVLNKNLTDLVLCGAEYVCMEVSAHAIYLDKLDGIKFEVMIWTNLTEDHLDFFGNMENYFLAKKKIFESEYAKMALINAGDDYGKRLMQSINLPIKTYAINSQADYEASKITIKNTKQIFKWNRRKISSKFLGEFNVCNLMSAIACFDLLGFDLKHLQRKINKLSFVPGRFNTIEKNGRLFIVDYAHTPDGLDNVLKLSKKLAGAKKLLCVFGCGGNRETQKRAKMGEISTKIADFTVITTDNPRFEDRRKIIEDIERGVVNKNYAAIVDRVDAIKFCYNISKEKDVILVAGKGAENYIDEMGKKAPYSDFDVIENLGK